MTTQRIGIVMNGVTGWIGKKTANTYAHCNDRMRGRAIDWMAWGLALLAMLPMLFVYLLHYLCAPPGYVATGFLQPDLPSYMADARAFFSNGFSLTYGLPFSANDGTPRIYFQPLMFLMGLAGVLTNYGPGTIFVATGVICGIIMFRVAIAMEVAFYGRPRGLSEWLTVLALLWGGGVVVFWSLGLLIEAKVAHQPVWPAEMLFAADAGNGGWFTNLGRNVYFANEAFYHVIFLAAIVLFVQRRYGLTLLMLIIMSASHPITGIELLSVIGAYSVWEFLFNRPVAPPVWFIATQAALSALHIFYYAIALPLLSPEHRVVQEQWDLPWVLTTTNIVAAYTPVMVLGAVHLARWHSWRMEISKPNVRFLLIWFAVAFVLANHEIFMRPHQPVHFTRGYIWTPLALLSLPVIDSGLRWAFQIKGRARSLFVVSVFLGLSLFDNITWFARTYFLTIQHGDHLQQYLRQEVMAAIERLGASDMRGRLLLSNDQQLAYLAIVYQPLRTWMSVGYLTPFEAQHTQDLEQFFSTGAEVPSWRGRPLVVVIDMTRDTTLPERLLHAGFTPVASYGRFRVLTRKAMDRS